MKKGREGDGLFPSPGVLPKSPETLQCEAPREAVPSFTGWGAFGRQQMPRTRRTVSPQTKCPVCGVCRAVEESKVARKAEQTLRCPSRLGCYGQTPQPGGREAGAHLSGPAGWRSEIGVPSGRGEGCVPDCRPAVSSRAGRSQGALGVSWWGPYSH